MTALRRLWAVPLSWSCAENAVSGKPCEEGMAVTADGVAHVTLAEAVAHAVELDGVVDVCPGRHEVEGDLDTAARAAASVPITVRGAGADATTLVSVGGGLRVGGGWRAKTFSALAISESATEWTHDDCLPAAESDEECDSPFDRNGSPEGALLVYGSVAFDGVTIQANQGFWGGAATLVPSTPGNPGAITFRDSVVVRNAALDSSGGALLVEINDSYDPGEEMTITSINTDWGAGDTDNTPDDIAFVSWDGYVHDSLTVHASYQFDGVADFTCSSLTYTCE